MAAFGRALRRPAPAQAALALAAALLAPSVLLHHPVVCEGTDAPALSCPPVHAERAAPVAVLGLRDPPWVPDPVPPAAGVLAWGLAAGLAAGLRRAAGAHPARATRVRALLAPRGRTAAVALVGLGVTWAWPLQGAWVAARGTSLGFGPAEAAAYFLLGFVPVLVLPLTLLGMGILAAASGLAAAYVLAAGNTAWSAGWGVAAPGLGLAVAASAALWWPAAALLVGAAEAYTTRKNRSSR